MGKYMEYNPSRKKAEKKIRFRDENFWVSSTALRGTQCVLNSHKNLEPSQLTGLKVNLMEGAAAGFHS